VLDVAFGLLVFGIRDTHDVESLLGKAEGISALHERA
jgi:hypothetical protein